jgi:hypothetical protein
MTVNRFNLEDAILAARQIEEDLDMLSKALIDWPNQQMDENDIHNYVFGIQMVTKLRNENLWQTFKEEFELDEYNRGKYYTDGWDEFFGDGDNEDSQTGTSVPSGDLPIPSFLREDAK